MAFTLTREGVMDEIDISLLENIEKNPDEPIIKSFSGINASRRTLYRRIDMLTESGLIKQDIEPGLTRIRITGPGKRAITGREDSAPQGDASS
jgi:predicted transcriptional regulator